MADVRYTKDHEWIRLDGDVGVVGITTYAQSQLGDVVYVELPAAGEVVAVNDALEAAPAMVNEDAEGKGWFLKLKLSDPKQLGALMSAEEYRRYVETIA